MPTDRAEVLATENHTRSPRLFLPEELSRVGLAAAIILAGGIAIVLAIMPVLGYSSLAQATPKAILDGAVIALLQGRRTRWRCLALLGVVLGMFLGFIMPAYPHLLLIMSFASLPAACVGYVTTPVSRTAAVIAAAIVFEMLASMGKPLQIYFGTADAKEPLLWGFWLAELPLRAVGVIVGVWITRQWLRKPNTLSAQTGVLASPPPPPLVQNGKPPARGTHRQPRAALCVTAAIIACTLPLTLESWTGLSCIAAAYLIFALCMGLGKTALHAIIGMLWGWGIYAVASYLYHGDTARVIDLFRTFALRFTPMTLTAMLIFTTVRPVEIIRLMKWLRLSGYVLIPLSRAVRLLPEAGRAARAQMKHQGRLSVLRRPAVTVIQMASIPMRWARILARE